MNKYLMLSAAAVLSSAATAQAGTYCFGFGTNGGGSYCDGAMVFTGIDGGAFGGSVRAWRHVNNNCSGGTSDGYGVLGKTPGLGKVSILSDNVEAQNYGTFGMSVAFQLPKKIKDGAEWAVWVGFAGTTFFQGNEGELTGVTNCQNGAVKGNGRKSTVASVAELIRAHRNARTSTAR
ncbi:MAG TPA: hypothetical protein VHU18_14130 [Rhizomicrobium sp.]|jgi:hypothetical protein|nr:hypothetical protein [Rhizomicrobium sp.]